MRVKISNSQATAGMGGSNAMAPPELDENEAADDRDADGRGRGRVPYFI
jgi:hypothetical protein